MKDLTKPVSQLLAVCLLASLSVVPAGCQTDNAGALKTQIAQHSAVSERVSPAEASTPAPKEKELAPSRKLPDIKVHPDFQTEAQDALQFVIMCNWVATRAHHSGSIDGDELDLIHPDNLDLTYFGGHHRLVDEAQTFIEDVFENRKLDGDRRIQQKIHDKKMRDAIWSSAPNPVAVLSSNWRAMGFVLAQSAFQMFMNFRKLRAEEELRYEQVVWDLDKQKMDSVQKFMVQKFKNEADILHEFHINGRFLAASKDLDDLIEQIDVDDPVALHKYLENPITEKKFMYALPYWYYRGTTAMTIRKFKDARDSFYTFQAIHRPILKHDRMAAIVAQQIAILLTSGEGAKSAEDRKELARQIKIVRDNSTEYDWDLHLFAANILFNVFSDAKGALDELDIAISVQDRLYRKEYSEYIEALKKARKLLVRDNGTTDSKGKTVTTVPPSQDILFQLRSIRHLFVGKTGSKPQLNTLVRELVKNEWVSPEEKLWHVAQEAKDGNAPGDIGNELKKQIASATSVFIDYDYCDDFWADAPIEWMRLCPTSIWFVVGSHTNIEDNGGVKKVVAPLVLSNPGASAAVYALGLSLRSSIPHLALIPTVLDAIYGFGTTNNVNGIDILPETSEYSRYLAVGRKRCKGPIYQTRFEGDYVSADRKAIYSYQLVFVYPSFKVVFFCKDADGKIEDIEWSDMYPEAVSLFTNDGERMVHVHFVEPESDKK